MLAHDGVVSDELRLSPYQTLRIVASAPELLELESSWSPGGTPPRTHWHPTQQEDFEVRASLSVRRAALARALGEIEMIEGEQR